MRCRRMPQVPEWSSLGPMRLPDHFAADVFAVSIAAAILSGIPSTLHAWGTGGDLLEATRAAGAMLISPASSDGALIASAALVHVAVTLFWAAILVFFLPDRHVIGWAVAASAAIAVLDLLVIAPLFFAAVDALPFGPQLADHLAWGAVAGFVLRRRRRSRGAAARTGTGG